MKNMKKLASLALALMLLVALCVPAMADTTVTVKLPTAPEGTPNTVTETYKAYKILDAAVGGEQGDKPITNPDGTGSTFSHVAYTISSNSPFYNTIKDFTGITLTEISTGTYNVAVDENTFSAADLAVALQAVVNADGFTETPAATGSASLTNPAELSLSDGYFLIVGSMGSKAILDTVGKQNVEITTKNNLPTIDKGEDETAKTPGNEPGVGDSIPYVVTVHAKPGALNYVVHDKLGTGLSFNDDVKVYVGENEIANSNYTVTQSTGDECSFHVTFVQSYLDTITAETDILVKYTATITAEAATLDEVENKVHLTYGEDNNTTEEKTTKHPLYDFEIAKTNSDTNGKEILDGAEFSLYTAQMGGDPISLVYVPVGGEVTKAYYRPATAEDTEGTTTTTIRAGIALIKGLGEGTYWLEETQAPTGYNKLSVRTQVEVNKEKDLGDVSTTETDGKTVYVNGGVRIENLTGAELPSTGGIGTTIFYIVGGVLVIGAVILLVTRKRVNDEA